MAKMKAMQVTAANAPFQLVERDVPAPGANQVRIKVEACGVCHSDMFVRGGAYPGLKLPRVPGHEVAGRVDAVGAGVETFKEGDAVGVGWFGGQCFRCEPCRRGQFINCENGKVTGIHHDGGYAEYVVVPVESLARVPAGLSAVEAGPILCAGVTTFNALRNAGARPGDTVGVIGLGGLGHLGVQYAAKMGFRVVAISRGADKAELGRKLGAHEYVDTAGAPAAEQLRKLGGCDLVLATAPDAASITAVVGGLKPRGKIVIVGVPHEPMSVMAGPLISGKSIAGWPSGTAMDSEDALRFSALTGVKPMTETFALDKAEDAYGKMMSNKVRFRAVLTM